MTERPPLCPSCGLSVKPCAPCCRHSGWVHAKDGTHAGNPVLGARPMVNEVIYPGTAGIIRTLPA